MGKIFLQINSAAVAFIDILIAAWEGLKPLNFGGFFQSLQFSHYFSNSKYLVASHFVPRSFRTQVISYVFWSFRTYFLVISYPVTTISYPGHFVPILVISYLVQLGTKWLYGGQFVPKSFCTLFGHFVPIWSLDGCMHACMHGRKGGWMEWQTDGRVLIEMTS